MKLTLDPSHVAPVSAARAERVNKSRGTVHEKSDERISTTTVLLIVCMVTREK